MVDKYIKILEGLAASLHGQVEWNSPIKWRELTAESGLASIDLPKEYGPSYTASQMAELFAFCGEIDLDLRDVPGAGHGRILTYAAQQNAYQQEIIQNLSKARSFLAIAITEEGAGSDIRNIQTYAMKVSDGYILNGSKLYVARLKEASHVILLARTSQSHNKSISAFVLPMNQSGLSISHLDAMGLRGTSFGGLELTNILVGPEMLIGNEGEGFELFKKHFTYWRIAMAAAAVGCGRGAIKQAVSWLQTRTAFEGPIGRFTHLQQELARHHAYLQMAWLLVQTAMQRLDQGESAYVDAAMVKAEAVEIALEAAEWAMKVYGARGYTQSLDIEKRVRDLMGLRVADGTTDVLRSQVARDLLGEDIYEASLGRMYD